MLHNSLINHKVILVGPVVDKVTRQSSSKEEPAAQLWGVESAASLLCGLRTAHNGLPRGRGMRAQPSQPDGDH